MSEQERKRSEWMDHQKFMDSEDAIWDGVGDMPEIKTFVFTRTVHNGASVGSDGWEYRGTDAGALKEYQDILARSWSPFVTFNYKEKASANLQNTQ